MNARDVFSQPFTQVTLPILIGFFLATVSQNKRIDDLRGDLLTKFDSIEHRLQLIQGSLHELDIRLTKIEAR